ncbi:Cobalt-zinc-cadmium resistance protein CzcC [bacterium HR15]|nr:Cobalt-zinc-cadmium resistance protein CzcC [bacterium HR15]
MKVLSVSGWIGWCGLWVISWAAGDTLTLEGALRLALQRNPTLQALRHEIDAAHRQVKSASRPASMLVLIAPALTAGGSDEELLLHQPLEWNGARFARTRIARAEQKVIHAQALLTLNRVLAEVASAYYEAFYREQIARNAQESLQNTEQVCELVRQQVEAGARAGIDLVQAEIERERVRQHAQLREAEARQASDRLRVLIGLPLETQPLVLQAPPTPPDESVQVGDKGVSPEIIHEQALTHLQEALLHQIRVEGRPDLGVQVRIERWRGERTRPAFGLSLQVPFIDYGARQQQRQAQQERLNAQRLRLQQTQRVIMADQRRAHIALETARARRDAYRTQILPRAEQLVQSTRIGLETGQITLLQVLEAERTARTVREEALQAAMELGVAWVEWQRVHGVFAQRFSQQCLGGDTR